MKPKPTPKELVVRKDVGGSFLQIWTSSDDAKLWILENAGQFGSFGESISGYFLIVAPTYDLDEVLAYMDSYNDEAS